MTQNDDEHDDEEIEDKEEEEVEVEQEETISPEKLRDTIRQIVDDALREALELRGKSRAMRMTVAHDIGRIGKEIRRAVSSAVDGAASGIYALDLHNLKKGLRGRTNTLMTRVRNEDIERMDLLVEAGLFESRSECAAFLVRAGLDARRDLVDKVQETAERIGDLKEQLRRELSGKGPET